MSRLVLFALPTSPEDAGSRPASQDRDKYVKVHFDRINEAGEGQFDINSKIDVQRPYDVLSLMHYGQDDFKKQGAEGHVIDVLP